jgi:hypothetical protein
LKNSCENDVIAEYVQKNIDNMSSERYNMIKVVGLMLTCLLLGIILVACGSGEEQNSDEEEVQEQTVETEETQVSVDDDADKEDEDSATNSDDNEGTTEPQLDLRLGDTGIVHSSIGTYELTIDSAQIVGTELDGEEALLDEIILLEMTFKNIGEEPIIAEDVMMNLGLTTDLDETDNTNAAATFESIEYFEGEIAPGEERKAQFITDTRTAEEYYFRTSPGTVAAGTQNEVIWTITDEEAR